MNATSANITRNIAYMTANTVAKYRLEIDNRKQQPLYMNGIKESGGNLLFFDEIDVSKGIVTLLKSIVPRDFLTLKNSNWGLLPCL